MRTPTTTTVLLLALLVLALTGLTACGGKAARERSQALLESQTGEKWFCQIAEDQTSWDCVQSNELAAAPAPERMPVPREELMTIEVATISDQALEVVEVEVDELEIDGTETIETEVVGTEVVEMDVVETAIAEADVLEPAVAETDVLETPVAEANVVETETDELEVGETDVVETETAGPDAVVTAADAADWPRAELYALPDDAYVVELVALPSAQALETLINDHGLTDVIAVRIAADGVFHHVLLTGPYVDEPTAQEFAALPPDHLRDFRLRVMPVRSLKVAMREADELANAVDDRAYVAGLLMAEMEVAKIDGVELDTAVAGTTPADLPNVELSTLPDDAYVVQLVAMGSARTLDYLIETRGLTDVISARVAADGEIYHVLLIGPFDEPGAQEFAAAPPDHLRDFQPWIRSVSTLKAAMREADKLSDGVDDRG